MSTAIGRFLAGLLLLPLAQTHAEEYRTWTDATGKYAVEAQFIKIEADNVTLKRKKDGKEIVVPLTKLSVADVVFVKNMSAAMPAPPKAQGIDAGGDPLRLVPDRKIPEIGESLHFPDDTRIAGKPDADGIRARMKRFRIGGAGKQDWDYEVRAIGDKELRLKAQGDTVAGNFSLIWVQQPYEIVDRSGKVLYRHNPPGGVPATTTIEKPKRTPQHGLPDDYAFLVLTKVDQPVDLTEVMPRPFSVTAQAGGKEILLDKGKDSVRGLRGKGLTVEQKGEGNVLQGSFRPRYIWTPEPIAC